MIQVFQPETATLNIIVKILYFELPRDSLPDSILIKGSVLISYIHFYVVGTDHCVVIEGGILISGVSL